MGKGTIYRSVWAKESEGLLGDPERRRMIGTLYKFLRRSAMDFGDPINYISRLFQHGPNRLLKRRKERTP